MAINFDAQVRLTEALLPLLRASAPAAIVNVSSTAGRVARAGSGAYSASKFALAGWSDSLWAEEREHGVHVGLVLPGFIATEGFPQSELMARGAHAAHGLDTGARGGGDLRSRARPAARSATCRAPTGSRPRCACWRPGLYRRIIGGGAAQVMTTTTGADLAERAGGRGRRSRSRSGHGRGARPGGGGGRAAGLTGRGGADGDGDGRTGGRAARGRRDGRTGWRAATADGGRPSAAPAGYG